MTIQLSPVSILTALIQNPECGFLGQPTFLHSQFGDGQKRKKVQSLFSVFLSLGDRRVGGQNSCQSTPSFAIIDGAHFLLRAKEALAKGHDSSFREPL